MNISQIRSGIQQLMVSRHFNKLEFEKYFNFTLSIAKNYDNNPL